MSDLTAAALAVQPASGQRRTLVVAGVAHALHDGYTDLMHRNGVVRYDDE